jgi:hypothetical protein
MGTLLVTSAISAGSIAFLSYFGFALWHDARRQKGKRVLLLRLREAIARKRYRPHVLYMHKLDAIQLHSGRRVER